ncbi:MAG: serine/threonine protein kinase, partial [Actinomadura sp.]
MGTAHYVSPEQASGQAITPATDLYSLGVVAFECLTGVAPFDADTPVAIALKHVRDLPPALPLHIPAPVRDLVRQLLAKRAAERPANAQEVADEAYVIRESLALGLEPGESRATGDDLIELAEPAALDTLLTEQVNPRRRSPMLLTSVAVGVLLLGVIVVGSLLRGPHGADLNGNPSKVPAVPVHGDQEETTDPGPFDSLGPGITPEPRTRIMTPSASPTVRATRKSPPPRTTTAQPSTPPAEPSGEPSSPGPDPSSTVPAG